jgi:polar amino acid transport system substrate-binding protein
MLLAILLGMTLAIANVYGPLPLRWLSRTYIELVRGTPLLIQLYLIYWGLPGIGIQLNLFTAAVVGLGLNYAAYEAENYRAGLTAVPRGQMEAALALGMHRGQAIWHVVVPQALRITIPPVTNDFVALLKDSSIVSAIGMMELAKKTDTLARISNDWIGIGLMAALVHFVIGLPFVQLARFAERKLAVDKRGVKNTAKRWFGGAGKASGA